MGPPSFLNHTDDLLIEEPNRFFPRSVVAVNTDQAEASKETPISLEDAIFNRVESLIEGLELEATSKWFKCFCISVDDRDGMSWSAQRVSAEAGRRYPQYTRWCLLNKTDPHGLPQIAALIGERSFLNLAAKHRLASRVHSLTWSTVVVIVLTLLAGVLGKVLETLLKFGTPEAPQPVMHFLADPLFYGPAAGIGLLGLMQQWLASRTGTLENSRQAFIKAEESELASSKDEFVGSLAEAIRRFPFPRFVIVDNFQAQDRTTKKAIERYFMESSRDAGGSEFWIVFDRRDGDLFSSRIAPHLLEEAENGEHQPSNYGYHRSELYRQVLLNAQQKRELARIVGHPENAEFTTVYYVCHGESEGEQRFQQLLLDARKREVRNPDRYGNLDFLYLLALTAVPGNVPMGRSFLRSRLAVKEGLRAEVLSQFLRGTKRIADEFERQLSEVLRSFGSVLILNEDGGAAQFRVRPEAAEVLEKLKGTLELPPSGVGHMFWSFLWHGTWRNHQLEAFWIHKLAYHLERCHVSEIEDRAVYDKIAPTLTARLVDMCLDSAEGALQCCLFRDVPGLLKKANLLMSELAAGDQPSRQKRLIDQCWLAYPLLGDRGILDLMEEMHSGPAGIHAVEKPSDSTLRNVFFDSIPFSAAGREAIRALPLERTGGPGRCIEDHALICSSWLGLSVRPMAEDGAMFLATAVREGAAALESLSERVGQRLKTTSTEGVRIVDMMTLSQALWCRALLANPAQLTLSDAESSALSAHPPADLFGWLLQHRFEAVAHMAEQSIEVAAEVQRRAADPRARESMDFMLGALAREVSVVAVASMLTAYHYQKGTPIWESTDGALLESVGRIFRSAEAVLSCQFPAISTWDSLAAPVTLQKVDEVMRLIGTIWATFDLGRLRDLLNIRRVHFNAICRHLTPEDVASYRPLLESEAQAVTRPDFVGLIANFNLAEFFARARDLSAYYLCAASSLALRGRLGAALMREFSMIAVRKAHNVNQDLTPFLYKLLEAEPDGESSLLHMLRDVPPQSVCGVLQAVANAGKSVRKGVSFRQAGENQDPSPGGAQKDSLTALIYRELKSAAEAITSEPEKREAHAMLDLFALEEQIQNDHAVDAEAVLEVWSDRKNLWLYAAVLRLLLEHGYQSARIRRASLDVLRHHPREDSWNSCLLLAWQLAERLAYKEFAGEDSKPAVAYLKNGIQNWEAANPADTNVRIYTLLSRLDAQHRSTYQTSVVRWQVVQMERDQQIRLPQLIEQGRFFLVFQDYYRWMDSWGIPVDMNLGQLAERRDLTAAQKTEAAQQWKQRGSGIPQPIVKQGRSWAVSGEFLIIGFWLFSSPLEQDPAFADERKKFNHAAAHSLQDLLSLAVNLPNLQPPIRELLEVFSKRLYSFSLPSDWKAAADQGAA